MQCYSGPYADRSHDEAGQDEKLLPNPSLEKAGWYAAALAGIAGVVLLQSFPIASRARATFKACMAKVTGGRY